MTSRAIVYTILISVLVLLGLFAWNIGAGRFTKLMGVGIIFLIIQFIRGSREEA